MPRRWIRVTPAAAMREGFEAVRREAQVPEAFAAAADEEAQRAAAAVSGAGERVDLPFITIDPPGSRDLDQAMHIERAGEGHRVRYAIADVGAFVVPGGALDADTHARGVTVYAPTTTRRCIRWCSRRARRACCPGSGARRSCGRSTSTRRASSTATHVARARCRSAAQHTYADVPPDARARC